MGSQKLTSLQPMTASVAMLGGTPDALSKKIAAVSTTPRPPGVTGMTATTFATPYAANNSTGSTSRPNAAKKHQRQAASSNQFAAAHPIASRRALPFFQ